MQNIHQIFGAPGCGKTTRLMKILEQELKENAPDRVAFVSFTKKGTYEGTIRAQARFGLKESELPYFRTLHSIAFRAMKLSKYDMIDKPDYYEFSKAMDMKFTGYYTEEFYNNDDKYIFLHFLKRNNPRAAEAYAFEVDPQKLEDVERNFERYKVHAKVYDFTDIIERFIKEDRALPVDVAIIDEAQDLTTLQWQMCEVAFKDCLRVYVAGDDDQAIYEWSGADVNYFLELKAKREVLDKSYRLQRKILDVAKRVSGMIERRIDKQFEALGDEGDVFVYNSMDEIEIDPSQTWYFLSRNNYFLNYYRDSLKRRALVFFDKDKLSVDPKHIEAINVFERCRRVGKIDDTSSVKLKLLLKTNVDMSKPWYDNLEFSNDDIAYYKDLIRCKTDLKNQKLTVSTIHGVKGGEAENVVLMLDFTKAVRANMERNPDSELRCLYVAITRAKRHLHIIHSASKNGYDNYMKVAT